MNELVIEWVDEWWIGLKGVGAYTSLIEAVVQYPESARWVKSDQGIWFTSKLLNNLEKRQRSMSQLVDGSRFIESAYCRSFAVVLRGTSWTCFENLFLLLPVHSTFLLSTWSALERSVVLLSSICHCGRSFILIPTALSFLGPLSNLSSPALFERYLILYTCSDTLTSLCYI